MNVVFLDYDGVVNTPRWVTETDENGVTKRHVKYNWPSDEKVNDEDAVQWVCEFCEKFDYKIVISSTWRRYKNYVSCLKNAGLRDDIEVIGRTNVYGDGDRNREISDYLSDHTEIENYLIFDDEDFFYGDDLHDHLILCDPSHGFKCTEFEKAIDMHNKFVREKNREEYEVCADSSKRTWEHDRL